jgi:hypothetical protein
LPGFNPVCPERGPYEASEGIYPVVGKGKNWGWARLKFRLTYPFCFDRVFSGSTFWGDGPKNCVSPRSRERKENDV